MFSSTGSASSRPSIQAPGPDHAAYTWIGGLARRRPGRRISWTRTECSVALVSARLTGAASAVSSSREAQGPGCSISSHARARSVALARHGRAPL
jgi:hypothetical protein